MLINIENWFLRNNLRTTWPGMMKLHVWIDFSSRKVPIDFGRDRNVGGASVTKNRKLVFMQ